MAGDGSRLKSASVCKATRTSRSTSSTLLTRLLGKPVYFFASSARRRFARYLPVTWCSCHSPGDPPLTHLIAIFPSQRIKSARGRYFALRSYLNFHTCLYFQSPFEKQSIIFSTLACILDSSCRNNATTWFLFCL